MEKRFSDKDVGKIRRCEDEQVAFRTQMRAKGSLSQQEQAALQLSSEEAVAAFWEQTLCAKANFDADHSHGIGKASRKTNEFMASAFDLLQGFSPMVDMIKDVASPYGGLAIGTISFLFAVAKNRTTMEDEISDTLLQIRDRLPGVKLYGHIYSSDDELGRMMQSKIVNAYESFMGFCMAASKFYTRPGYRRMFMVLGINQQLNDRGLKVQKAVVDVRRAGEELLSRNVHIIRKQNDDLKQQIQKLQDGQDAEKLENIRQLLHVDPFSLKTQIPKLVDYRGDITAEFKDSGDFSEKTYPERLQVIETDKDFQEWISTRKSRLLVLSGRNEISDATNCWASPVALDLIWKLTSTGPRMPTDVCAFCILKSSEGNPAFQGVLERLVHQLLTMNKHTFRDEGHLAEIRADLGRYTRVRDLDDGISAVQEPVEKLLLRVLNSFDKEKTVWIVLDRVDRCQTRGPERYAHRLALLHTLARLVRESRTLVKVLAVVNAVDWNVESLKGQLCRREDGSVIVRTISEEEAG